jgi:hypothetical protein
MLSEELSQAFCLLKNEISEKYNKLKHNKGGMSVYKKVETYVLKVAFPRRICEDLADT